MNDLTEIKNQMMNELSVEHTDTFDITQSIEQRIDYLKQYMKIAKRYTLVSGISGGVDSFVAGKMAQEAVKELREENYKAQFIALCLPYGIEYDEEEAQQVLDLIQPDNIITINLKSGVDSIHGLVFEGINESNLEEKKTISTVDSVKGNVKARMRMVTQYEIAGLYKGMVLGSDHNAEAVNGFYTHYGDGACDLLVLNGMNKRQVRLCAKRLGAPEWLWRKVATADLKDFKEKAPDEKALGVTYDQIDDLLEGKSIDPKAEKAILERYYKTQFKRRLPIGFGDIDQLNINS